MWSGKEASTVDEIFAVLKEGDNDWLTETLRHRYDKLKNAYDSPCKNRGRTLKHKRESTDDSVDTIVQGGEADYQDYLGPHDSTATIINAGHAISSHVELIRTFDWSSTELGPMSTWSAQLRQTVNFLLADPRAATIYWGANHILIYNDAYQSVLAERHPWALGKPVHEVWPETEALKEIQDAIRKADATGEASSGDRAPFFIYRRGFLEEMYGDWSIIPILGNGTNVGYYNTVLDLTSRMHEDRQMATLLKLEKETADVKVLEEFWPAIIEGLQHNREEAPFAALYAAVPRYQRAASRTTSMSSSNGHPDVDSLRTTRRWTLEGTLGTQYLDKVFPHDIDSEWATQHITTDFKDCILTSKVQVIPIKPESHMHPAAKSRAYGDQCSTAVLIPLGRVQDGDSIGFLLLGISSRRYYDLNYKQFIRLLTRQLCSTLTAVQQSEEAARKANMQAELAALDRMLLSEKLALTEQQARDNERRFRSIASHMPMAMYELSPHGDITYANDAYYELLGVRPENLYPYIWVDTIHTDDLPVYEQNWAKLAAGESVRFEARLKKKFTAADALTGETIEADTWLLSAAFSVKSDDGSIQHIQGALIDISRQKLLETFQARRLEEAIELKRQQEHFMDFVGHEIRNPLSATSLCASSIQVTLEDLLKNATLEDTTDTIRIDRETIQSQIENTEIITTCIQHQKRIIDDVLTLSKLDSNLLVVTPCETNPADLIQQSLRLFEAEVQAADTALKYVIDKSYRDMSIKWALLDPSRLLQILINLITNAIRFTKNELRRTITVTLAASKTNPPNTLAGIPYLSQPNATLPNEEDQDDEDVVYLLVAVADTGCGMKPDELERIFLRFQQSSHKTHIEYGGSGLGLFISRELARLQGGQIGVHSQHGIGSTFEFYIKARRCEPPVQTNAKETEVAAPQQPKSTEQKKAQQPEQATHILLVEDNLVNQKVMDRQLRKAGYQVHLANHGVEALEHIRRSTYCRLDGVPLDIVFMDIEMPVMGGLECTRRIRNMDSKRGRLPIIAITANARGEQQTQALDAGVDAVVTKPFQMGELLGVVERLWGRADGG